MRMITAEIDLSVGSTFVLAPYTMGLLSVILGVPVAVGAVAEVASARGSAWPTELSPSVSACPLSITTVGTLFFVQGIVVSICNSSLIMTPVEEPFNQFLRGEPVQPTRGRPVVLA